MCTSPLIPPTRFTLPDPPIKPSHNPVDAHSTLSAFAQLYSDHYHSFLLCIATQRATPPIPLMHSALRHVNVVPVYPQPFLHFKYHQLGYLASQRRYSNRPSQLLRNASPHRRHVHPKATSLIMVTDHIRWVSTALVIGVAVFKGWRYFYHHTPQRNRIHCDATGDHDKSVTNTSQLPPSPPHASPCQVMLIQTRDAIRKIRETLTDLEQLIQLSQKYGQDYHAKQGVAKIVVHLRSRIHELSQVSQPPMEDQAAEIHHTGKPIPEIGEYIQAITAQLDVIDRLETGIPDTEFVQHVQSQLAGLHNLIESSQTWSATLEHRLRVLAQKFPNPNQIKGAIQEQSERVKRGWEDTLNGMASSMVSGTFVETIRDTYTDPKVHPEVRWEAQVRCGSELPLTEIEFRANRLKKVVCPAFARFIGVPEAEVTPENVPVIALAGSGGGYRAMVSTLGYLTACDEAGVLDCSTYLAGVSGSCWTIMQYFVAARGSTTELEKHISQQITTSLTSVSALTGVLTSPAAASVFAGLVSKFDSGMPLSLVDIYGTLLMSRLLMRSLTSTGDPADAKLTGQQRYLADGRLPMPIYTAVRHEIIRTDGKVMRADDPETGTTVAGDWKQGLPSMAALKSKMVQIMPGSHVAPKEAADTPESPTASESSSAPASPALLPDDTDAHFSDTESVHSAMTHMTEEERVAFVSALGLSKTHKYQWFEFTPYEMGTIDGGGVWIPAWGFGRPFRDGRSLRNLPEPSAGLYLGMFGSAFCATIAHLIDEVKGTLSAPVHQYLEGLVRDYQLAVTTTHPIAPSCFHNPFYRPSEESQSEKRTDEVTSGTREISKPAGDSIPAPSRTSVKDNIPTSTRTTATTEAPQPTSHTSKPKNTETTTLFDSEQLCLMDAGMNNNLPFYPLLRPERNVDVILLFDASSDIDETPWFERAEKFARQHGITRWPKGAAPWPRPSPGAHEPPTHNSAPNVRTDGEGSSSHRSAKPESSPKSEADPSNSAGEDRTPLTKLADVAMDPISTTHRDLTDQPNPFADGHRCAIFTEPASLSQGTPQFAEQSRASPDRSSGTGGKSTESSSATSQTPTPPSIALVYYPLLANPEYEVADFDPATADFCSTYNFSYTPEQVKSLSHLSQYNFMQEKENLRDTLKQVWLRKKTYLEKLHGQP
ncbi:hypothetical protein H4R33_003960 [Dimargaris cristalligena]|nr:hypothetical protein H4R33_003960 [Dimargaris cristalligena]